MPQWTVETVLTLKNGNTLTHRCVVDTPDEESALKKAKSAWNRDITFGRGEFAFRVIEADG